MWCTSIRARLSRLRLSGKRKRLKSWRSRSETTPEADFAVREFLAGKIDFDRFNQRLKPGHQPLVRWVRSISFKACLARKLHCSAEFVSSAARRFVQTDPAFLNGRDF